MKLWKPKDMPTPSSFTLFWFISQKLLKFLFSISINNIFGLSIRTKSMIILFHSLNKFWCTFTFDSEAKKNWINSKFKTKKLKLVWWKNFIEDSKDPSLKLWQTLVFHAVLLKESTLSKRLWMEVLQAQNKKDMKLKFSLLVLLNILVKFRQLLLKQVENHWVLLLPALSI